MHFIIVKIKKERFWYKVNSHAEYKEFCPECDTTFSQQLVSRYFVFVMLGGFCSQRMATG